MDQSKAQNRATRIRTKAAFLEAEDPELALTEFFQRLCSNRSETPRGRSKPGSFPLVLISQLPRSGGSLLSQLLDGHCQFLVYPWEMTIGYPAKHGWPILNVRESPDRLFVKLFDTRLVYLAKEGYRKWGKAKQKEKRLTFDYSPLDHFLDFLSALPSERTQRAVLDVYFETFFRSWHSVPTHPRYIAGFAPHLASRSKNVTAFFRDYPDGRLVSIIRDPADWFASRCAHTKRGEVRYNDICGEMALWNRMAAQALQYKRAYGDRFLLLDFRDLVSDREGTMRRVSAWLGIKFDPCLLHQTFNGNPVQPNTNFGDPVERLAEAVLDRKARLRSDERARIYQLTNAWCAKLHQAGWTGSSVNLSNLPTYSLIGRLDSDYRRLAPLRFQRWAAKFLLGISQSRARPEDDKVNHSRPPKALSDHQQRLKRVRSIARAMDDQFTIPGTRLCFGWDAIVGMLPGLGDVLTSAISLAIVNHAWRLGMPPVVLRRMLVNIGVELVLGCIPVLGDGFDLVWKANRKNARLLELHMGMPSASANAMRAVERENHQGF